MQLLQYVVWLGISGKQGDTLLALPLTLGGITYVVRTKVHDLNRTCTRTTPEKKT